MSGRDINMEDDDEITILESIEGETTTLIAFETEDGTKAGEYIIHPGESHNPPGTPSWEMRGRVYKWFIDDDPLGGDLDWLSVKDVASVAQYFGVEPDDFHRLRPLQIYMAVGSYFGYENLDGYPDAPTEQELTHRWPSYFRLDSSGDLADLIERTVRFEANEHAARRLSEPDEMEILELEREGYDPDSVVRVAEFGDATAINGHISESQSEQSEEQRTIRGLTKMQGSGAWPGGEDVSLDVDSIVIDVARASNAPRGMVHAVFHEVYEDELRAGRDRDILYTSSDNGYIGVYARRA